MTDADTLSGRATRSAIKVLMYHRVASDRERLDDYPWKVTVAQLQSHMELLEVWGYTTVCFEDISTSRDGMLNLPRRPVILTFDDGCRQTSDNVMMVLSKFKATATFFVLGNPSIRVSDWDGPKGYAAAELMSQNQVRSLHAAGFEVGSHSMNHPDLTHISRYEIEREIVDSKKSLEDSLQEEVTTFAYPFGAVNQHAKEVVADAGYSYGCGVYSGPPRFGMDLYNMRRIPITQKTTPFELAMKMLAPYEYYAWVRWTVRHPFRSFTEN